MRIRSLIFGGACLSLLCLGLSPATNATKLCVDPAQSRCFGTIQAAVTDAQEGDTIVVYPKKDGSPYNESIAVNTANLTIKGAGKSKYHTFPFQRLGKIDWHKEKRNCPVVKVDVCQTLQIPNACGIDEGPPDGSRSGFVLNAPSITVQNLTIRHAEVGVFLKGEADNATLDRVCLIANGTGLGSQEETDQVHLVRSRIFGAGNAVIINGNNIRMQHNLVWNVQLGMSTTGDEALITLNAFKNVAKDCIKITGDRSTVNWNLMSLCGSGAISLVGEGGEGSKIQGNTVRNSSLDTPAIVVALQNNARIRKNVLENIGAVGIALAVTRDSWIQGNVIDSVRLVGIGLQSSNNTQILDNRIRFSGDRGMIIDGNDNLFRGNRIEKSGTSGLVITEGTNNTVEQNSIRDNNGEGLANLSGVTGTNLVGNTVIGNRTDICNDGTIGTFASNKFNTGGEDEPCIVEQ